MPICCTGRVAWLPPSPDGRRRRPHHPGHTLSGGPGVAAAAAHSRGRAPARQRGHSAEVGVCGFTIIFAFLLYITFDHVYVENG